MWVKREMIFRNMRVILGHGECRDTVIAKLLLDSPSRFFESVEHFTNPLHF